MSIATYSNLYYFTLIDIIDVDLLDDIRKLAMKLTLVRTRREILTTIYASMQIHLLMCKNKYRGLRFGYDINERCMENEDFITQYTNLIVGWERIVDAVVHTENEESIFRYTVSRCKVLIKKHHKMLEQFINYGS